MVGCWKCWCLFFAQVTAEMLMQARLPPPSLRLGPPWPCSLPNTSMSASTGECSERCTPASPAAVGAMEQRRRHHDEAHEDG